MGNKSTQPISPWIPLSRASRKKQSNRDQRKQNHDEQPPGKKRSQLRTHVRPRSPVRRRALRFGAGFGLSLFLSAPDAGAGEAAARAEMRLIDGKENLHVEVEGQLEWRVSRVRVTLLDLHRFPEWFPALAAWEILSESDSHAIVHGVQDFPWPWPDRDYVVDYEWDTEPDGRFRLEATALSGAAPPPTRGVIRVEDMRTVWTLEAIDGGTRVRYEYEGDPQIEIPEWLVESAWQRKVEALLQALESAVQDSLQQK